MATLKDIQRKIGAVKKTKQITRAMGMVATSRLRGAQEAAEQFRPYADKFRQVLGSMASRVEGDVHPFFQKRDSVTKVGLVLMTGDRGLCGSFNVNLITLAERFLKERDGQVETVLITAGKKGRDYFSKRNRIPTEEYLDVLNKPDFELARELSRNVTNLYLEGEVDEVYLIYTEFESVARQVPMTRKLLPLSPEDLVGDEDVEIGSTTGEYLVEPSPDEVLIDLLPKNLSVQMLSALLETACSQWAAQMMAMENATNNCKDMIDNLTLIYNKARQAAITAELMDIVGGAEALKQ
jgi:F-type H+-transporting ATPase subunit gamma